MDGTCEPTRELPDPDRRKGQRARLEFVTKGDASIQRGPTRGQRLRGRAAWRRGLFWGRGDCLSQSAHQRSATARDLGATAFS